MALRTSGGRRRLSLELIHRAVSDFSSADGGIAKYIPSNSNSHVISSVECECCGLSEDCTAAYVKRVRDRFCGRWVCGLCSEAIKEELDRCAVDGKEEALAAHMEVCRRFNKTVRVNPAMSLANGMREILKKSSSQRNGGGNNMSNGVRIG